MLSRNRRWKVFLDELNLYKEEHGTLDISQTELKHQNPQLHRRISKVRRQYRRHQTDKPTTLTASQIRDLNGLGFVWKSGVEDGWSKRLEELKSYHEEHGSWDVSGDVNPGLAKFALVQRRQYRRMKENKPTKLTEERFSRLESIGFCWDMPLVSSSHWDDMFRKLEEYRDEFGDCDVTAEYRRRPRLHLWVKRQRRQYALKQRNKPSVLTEERVARLQSLGFRWEEDKPGDACGRFSADSAKWDTMFQKLQRYRSNHGDCNVPRSCRTHPRLARWVDRQKRQYLRSKRGKPSKLTKHQLEQLQQLGWDQEVTDHVNNTVKCTNWNNKFHELQQYKDEHGDCMVPKDYLLNRNLAKWVARQRKQYQLLQQGKRSRMTPQKIDQLDSMGFLWEMPDSNNTEIKWTQMVERLKQYQAEHGDCSVPKLYRADPDLGKWVVAQRRNHRRLRNGKPSGLTKQRVQELDRLGFKWRKHGGTGGRPRAMNICHQEKNIK